LRFILCPFLTRSADVGRSSGKARSSRTLIISLQWFHACCSRLPALRSQKLAKECHPSMVKAEIVSHIDVLHSNKRPRNVQESEVQSPSQSRTARRIARTVPIWTGEKNRHCHRSLTRRTRRSRSTGAKSFIHLRMSDSMSKRSHGA
ncbi:abc transporter, partial [Moniliophthora roreri]